MDENNGVDVDKKGKAKKREKTTNRSLTTIHKPNVQETGRERNAPVWFECRDTWSKQ
jgi:hypothetical protein